jgi:hypothetical protein
LHIPCMEGHPTCYPINKLCVFDYDPQTGYLSFCRNGAHLKSCRHIDCPSMFKCHQSYCIPLRFVCNGKADCPTGLEEHTNFCRQFACPGLFRCKRGNCLHPTEVCDGITHCPHGDDETKLQ